MSQKNRNSRSTRVGAESRIGRTMLVTVAVVVLVFTLAAVTFLYERDDAESEQDAVAARQAALASEHSPTIGDPGARVHVVEFLDPACETCALFYPLLKQWMSEVPGEIRLSVRHVAFHTGADYAVRVLEASRNQDKYWQTLEALLATQQQWTQHHAVLPERIGPAIASVGLNMTQLMIDMDTVEVRQRIEQDKKDSILLQVSATPEYFVNGRPLPSFGRQQLANLIREELGR